MRFPRLLFPCSRDYYFLDSRDYYFLDSRDYYFLDSRDYCSHGDFEFIRVISQIPMREKERGRSPKEGGGGFPPY